FEKHRQGELGVDSRIEGDHEEGEGERCTAPEQEPPPADGRRGERSSGEPGGKTRCEHLDPEPERADREGRAPEQRARRRTGYPPAEHGYTKEEHSGHVVRTRGHDHVEVKAKKAVAQSVGR